MEMELGVELELGKNEMECVHENDAQGEHDV